MTGTLTQKPTTELTPDALLDAYRVMRTIRDFEERVHEEFASGDIPGFVHLYAGEEASAAGICAHLTDRDAIASTHRGHGHCIAKGVDIQGMMAEIYGRATGSCRGKGGSMHIADLSKGMLGANGIVGGGPPLICGRALASKIKGDGGVAVAFFGDGASNQGTTLESLNLASIWNLPAIFVAENNGYAEATSSTWSVATDDIADRAAAFGDARCEQRGFDSSTTTSRPVFSTDSRMVSVSSGRGGARVDHLGLDARRRELARATRPATSEQEAFGALRGPIQQVTGPHTPVPFADSLEDLFIPDAARVAAAVKTVVDYER
jgi:TPP-dependent pyruvate/acetoin dehydrogenase alpha subunit